MEIKGYNGLVIITGSILLIVINFGIYVWIYKNSHNSKYTSKYNYNVGDTVLVDTSKIGRGIFNAYKECEVIKSLEYSILIRCIDEEDSNVYWEEWIDPKIIIDCLVDKNDVKK